MATIAHKKKYIYCVTFSWPFLHQNHQRRGGCYCVTYSWPFFICFSTCCRALNTPPTVSPLLGTVNSILSRKKMTLNCVTYTCPSSCKKKAGTISKKMISPGTRCQSSSSKFWQRIHRTRQSTKKIWQTRQLISKKTKSKMKKMMGLQRFLLYKPFLS